MQFFKIIFTFLSLLLASSNTYAQNTDTLSVFFDTDSHVLTNSQSTELDKFISEYDSVFLSKITIHAFCDDRGSKAYNIELSRKRGKFIQEKFSNADILCNDIVSHGKGEVALINSRIEEDIQRNNNRRAVVIIEFLKIELPPIIVKKDIIVTEEVSLEKMKVGDKITLKNILFIGGRHILLPESYLSLEELVLKLQDNPSIKILILGHICCQYDGLDGMDHDTRKRNLSVARAKTVYLYLIENGIAIERLQYKGLKAAFPTGKDVKYDRRVEIQFTQVQK
jgi:outer membrane protein OmpA-like peptidoglycan-associated protein